MSRHLAPVWRAAGAGLAVFSFTAIAESGPEPHLKSFGPFGIVRGQVARLNVANATVGNPDIIPPCLADLSFLDATGGVVAETRETVAAGRSAFLDVTFIAPPDPEASRGPAPSRMVLRGLVRLNPPPEPDAPPACVLTLEVYVARTGRAHLLLGGPDTVGNPNEAPQP
jgi:hypothetical protein